MLSKTLNHYPRFVFRNGEKKLFNPVLRRTFKNLPEERVRLRVIEYLVLEAGLSKHRLSQETPLKLPGDKSASRTDLIFYDDNFKPKLLIECKAAQIKLNDAAAQQVARYNAALGAQYLMLTNGIQDLWFNIHDAHAMPLQAPPSFVEIQHEISRNFTYWLERGFAGERTRPEIRAWIIASCKELYLNPESPSTVRYMRFDESPDELQLDGYYHLKKMTAEATLATGFCSDPFGAPLLNLLLSKSGSTQTVLSIQLNMLAKQEKENAILYSSTGAQNIDAAKYLSTSFNQPLDNLIKDLFDLLTQNL